jgi:hypothetical protein
MAAKRRTRIGQLSTITMVGNEIARCYKQSRRGEMDPIDAFRYASVLSMLAKTMTDAEVERRLDAIEAHDAAQSPKLKVV